MRSLVRLVMTLMIAVSFVARPKEAQAIGVLAGGVIYSAYAKKPAETSEKNYNLVFITWAGILVGSLLGSAGLVLPYVILDADSGDMQLTALDSNDAALLAITESQRVAYNENVDILNGIAEEIYFTFGDDGTHEEMNAAWEYYLNAFEVPQDARDVFAKIAEALLHQMPAQ